MPTIFDSIRYSSPGSNVFDLTHDVKYSCNMGLLVPNLVMECVPGDKFTLGSQQLTRFAPLVAPVMHRYNVYQHYFFVPNRLLWDNWENYITNTKVGGFLPAHPTIYLGNGGAYTKLYDYLGLPGPASVAIQVVNPLPFAAYQFIYNEYYRDQNLIAEVNYKLVDGDNDPNSQLKVLRRRAWEHDYFTSALPSPQLGPGIDIPMTFQDVLVKRDMDPTGPHGPNTAIIDSTAGGPWANIQVDSQESTDIPSNALYADTSSLHGNALLSDLRRAKSLQEWVEKALRGGSRYIENILSFFGVRSSDKRLDRPEYITGSVNPIIISEVLNTTGTIDAPQGEMAGHGVSAAGGKFGSYFCEEYGYIIGISSIMPKTSYFQGIPKHFLKINNPLDDYFWPQFEGVGEQAILRKEIYADWPDGHHVFGYTPRFAEYKYMSNRVAGDFRYGSLNYWHQARIFGAVPFLNQAFVECAPDFRIFAVIDPAVDHVYCQIVHQIKAVRKMQKYGNPTF